MGAVGGEEQDPRDEQEGGEQAEDTPPGGRQNRGGDDQDDQRGDQKRTVPDSQPPSGPGLGPGGPRHLTGEPGVGGDHVVLDPFQDLLLAGGQFTWFVGSGGVRGSHAEASPGGRYGLPTSRPGTPCPDCRTRRQLGRSAERGPPSAGCRISYAGRGLVHVGDTRRRSCCSATATSRVVAPNIPRPRVTPPCATTGGADPSSPAPHRLRALRIDRDAAQPTRGADTGVAETVGGAALSISRTRVLWHGHGLLVGVRRDVRCGRAASFVQA